MKEVRARCQQTWPVTDLYDRLDKLGLEYGPVFVASGNCTSVSTRRLTKVQLPDGLANPQYAMHPAFLDACLHAYPLVLDRRREGLEASAVAPTCPSRWRDFAAIRMGSTKHGCTPNCGISRKTTRKWSTFGVYDDGGAAGGRTGRTGRAACCRLIKWYRSRRRARTTYFIVAVGARSVRDGRQPGRSVVAPASWLIFADAKGVGVALASRLEAAAIIATSSTGTMHSPNRVPERGP